MLPLQTWYEATVIEPSAVPPPRRRPRLAAGLRRAIGRRLVELGQALAGDGSPIPTSATR